MSAFTGIGVIIGFMMGFMMGFMLIGFGYIFAFGTLLLLLLSQLLLLDILLSDVTDKHQKILIIFVHDHPYSLAPVPFIL